MIQSYSAKEHRLIGQEGLAATAIWFDILAPEPGEEAELEALLGIELPTREEMAEIEVSSRIYSEDGALYMTALLPAQADTDRPVMSPVSFVLAGGRLVTIRDHAPRAFETFARRAQKTPMGCVDGVAVFVAILDTIVDRLADVLERVAREIDALSRRIFDEDKSANAGGSFRPILQEIGRKGDMTSNIRESLVTVERVVSFVLAHARADAAFQMLRDGLMSIASDVTALSVHSDAINQKINFLLDATLGLINIEQNGIMQIFSVVAVVFLPPTLVASIYGMNFGIMPELAWPWGYPFALALMLLSAVGPYLFFKRRGWL
jgi:magnesium transporter